MRKRTYIQWTFLLLVSPNESLYHFVVLPTSTSIKYCSIGLKKHLDTYMMNRMILSKYGIWKQWYFKLWGAQNEFLYRGFTFFILNHRQYLMVSLEIC